MKAFIGIALCIIGIAVGLYFGIWWAFIGGIVQVIEQVKADDIDALSVAFGVARVLFAGGIGWISGLLFVIPGMAFISNS